MEAKRLLSLTRKAIDGFNMIRSGDKIAVGISGGKDSLTLLYAMSQIRRFYPEKFELCAITVDLGFDGFDTGPIQNLCDSLDVEYKVVNSDIYRIIFEERRETNPCSLCAKMRKGALNDAILSMGCNKVAYAHHKDDVIETFLMSLIFEGRIHTFSPVTYLDRTKITVIRPLLYIEEADIIGFVNKMKFPVMGKKCPADGNTKREYVKNLIKQLNHENPGVAARMFTAILRSSIKGWGENEQSELS